jgi:HEAT repeat protein
LRDSGEKARPALPQLLRVLRDKRLDVRAAAFAALLNLDAAAAAVPLLNESLSDRCEHVRAWAARAVAAAGPHAKAAVPALLKSIQDEDPVVRVRSAEALWRAGIRAELAVRVLRAAFRDGTDFFARDPFLRRAGNNGWASLSRAEVRARRIELVRTMAGEILKRIDPAAARQAGVPQGD